MKIQKWHLILIGGLVIVVFGLAIIVYVFKTPTVFGYTPNTWDLIFDFLDKWASAGAPAMTLLAVAVALAIGLTSILQTRSIQQSERKQRLVKEIEEWAKEVIRFIAQYERTDPHDFFRSEWGEWWPILKETKTHMKEIAGRIDKDFGEIVSNAITDFDTIDNAADESKRTRSNIQNELEHCESSCRKALQMAGVLKFKELH